MLADDHAADPRDDRPAVHRCSPKLDWINTFWPLIVPKFLATDAFFIFLMVQFIRGLPRELDEAAAHRRLRALRGSSCRIILPLCVPALATTGDLHLHLDLERLLQPAHLPDRLRTCTPCPSRCARSWTPAASTSWGPLFAMSIVSLGPIFGFFLAGQRYLVRGIATTGIK